MLAFSRRHPLDFPQQYTEAVRRGEVIRVVTPAGDPAWLVTRHDDVQAVLSHPAMALSHSDPEHAPRFSNSIVYGGSGGESAKQHSRHLRWRQILSRAFSGHRMEQMRPQVQAIVDHLLDRMEQHGSPADLHEAVSFQLPVNVICALLGVPFEDHDRFRVWSTGATSVRDPALADDSMRALRSYMGDLIDRKRAQPGEDVISDLIAADQRGTVSADEVIYMAGMLLIAGHETTVARIDTGALLLLTHPTQRLTLAAHPELTASAVEEILRLTMASAGVILRYAQADVVIRETTIRAGELVLASVTAANRDPRVFADPDSFDICREPNPHLAFAYGAHYCLGAGLARVELQCVLGALLHRFPTLALAVSLEDLELRNDLLVAGVVSLPVTW